MRWSYDSTWLDRGLYYVHASVSHSGYVCVQLHVEIPTEGIAQKGDVSLDPASPYLNVNPVEEWGFERYAIMMVSIDSSHSRWVSCTHKRNLEVTELITLSTYEFTIGWYLAGKVCLLSSFISWEMKALPFSESVVVFGVSVRWDLCYWYFLKG